MKLAPYDGEFDAKRSPLDRSGLLIIYVVYIDAKFTFKARNSLSMKFESYTIEEKATTRQCGMMSLCLFRRSHVKRGFPATFFKCVVLNRFLPFAITLSLQEILGF